MARRWIFPAVAVALAVLYLAGQRHNPPGFYSDEASIAYNALRIAREGVDEHGARYPLFFKAFGEYKNPVYIYLLSGVFQVLDPGPLVARRLSAILGLAAAAALGWLAWRQTGKSSVALLTAALAALTPMIFEISRLAFEVALFPLAIASFLLAADAAARRERWSWTLVLGLTATLALVTYTYTAGRLLAPLFAAMLLLFATRKRAAPLAAVWILYALTLLPMFAFNSRSEGALMTRARFLAPKAGSRLELLVTIERNFIANLAPLGMVLAGDPNPRHHVPGSGGSILLVTFVLAAIGAAAAIRERWTIFLLLGALASLLPGAITKDVHHALRLSAYPVFLTALAIPAWEWLFARRRALAVVAFVGLAQAGFFFVQFHRKGPSRGSFFDGGGRQVLDELLLQPQRPIFVRGPYVHAYWFGALRGVDQFAFVPLAPDAAPPSGSLVYTDHEVPGDAIPISRHGIFSGYYVP